MLNIDELTFDQIKQLKYIFSDGQNVTNVISAKNDEEEIKDQVGEYVIVRTYSAGVWFGKVIKKCGTEVLLTEARRMFSWKTLQGISLSECAMLGIDQNESRICFPVHKQLLQWIEIISMTDVAIKSLKEAENYVKDGSGSGDGSGNGDGGRSIGDGGYGDGSGYGSGDGGGIVYGVGGGGDGRGDGSGSGEGSGDGSGRSDD